MRYKSQSVRGAYADVEPYDLGRKFVMEQVTGLAADMGMDLNIKYDFEKKKKMLKEALGKGTSLFARVMESRER